MSFSVEQALQYLEAAYRGERLPHSLLVSGPEGSGKQRLTKELFRLVNGKDAQIADFHQIEPESKSRRILVEQVRQLEGHLRMTTAGSKKKFGVIVEADRLMLQAANAFLKTLEEPPERSQLLLLTALPDALLPTIRSRCIHVPLRLPARDQLTKEEESLIRDFSGIILADGFSVVSALRLARSFQEALQSSRARLEAEHAELFRRDQAAYRQTTDGKWLQQREEQLAVLTESRYVKARSNLVLRMLEWLGDVLRFQSGSDHLDLPEFQEAASLFSTKISSAEMARRFLALEELTDLFSKNIQESLATEAVFLKAFGPPR
jgi:DNA polymerase III subunit delta'